MLPSRVGRFEAQGSVFENIVALRTALGSATRSLSRDDLAKMISREHSDRSVNGSTIQRWEEGVEPDLESIRILAEIAGVSFEVFALGDPKKRRTARAVPKGAFRRTDIETVAAKKKKA